MKTTQKFKISDPFKPDCKAKFATDKGVKEIDAQSIKDVETIVLIGRETVGCGILYSLTHAPSGIDICGGKCFADTRGLKKLAKTFWEFLPDDAKKVWHESLDPKKIAEATPTPSIKILRDGLGKLK